MATENIGAFRVGYSRVSTARQEPALQRDALTAAGCDRIYEDIASGKLEQRPAFDDMLANLRRGDTVIVWRLDRLGRSLRHLIDVVSVLQARGVAFCSLSEAIDTSTPGGKLIFHVFASLSEFERDLIRERTVAGLTAARSRGRVGGRPSIWTPEKLATARRLYEAGDHSVASIARIVGVSRASVYRGLAKDTGISGDVSNGRRNRG